MDKKALRRLIGEKKRAMSAWEIETRSRALAGKLWGTTQYRQATSLYCYLAYNQEVRTEPIIRKAWADGKRVAVPKVIGDEIIFIWLESFDQLCEGTFGILEPAASAPIAADETALMLLPGLAFDRAGHRLGYGGGYYDRYLDKHPCHPTIALCYSFQLLDAIEAEPHDKPVDWVIPE